MRRSVHRSRTAYVLLLAAFTLLLGLAACARRPPPTGGTALPANTLIAVIGPSRNDPDWIGISSGAQRYAAERAGVRCLAAAPDEETPAALAATVQAALEKGPHAVCLLVRDPEAAAPVIRTIRSRGALLVTMGQPVPDEAAWGHVEVNLPGGAELLGAHLDEMAAGRLSYLLFHQDGRNRTASLCYARFLSGARDKSRLTMLDDVNTATAGRPQRELIAEMVARFPHVGLVICLDPQPWLSLNPRFQLPAPPPRDPAASRRAAPAAPPELAGPPVPAAASIPARLAAPPAPAVPPNRFATLAAAPRLWPRLLAGEAAALVGPLDGEIGAAAVELAITGLMQVSDTPRLRTISCELVTAATLPDFAQRYAQAAGLDPAALLAQQGLRAPLSTPESAPAPESASPPPAGP